MIIYLLSFGFLFVIGILSMLFSKKNSKVCRLIFIFSAFLVFYFMSILKGVNVGRDTIAYFEFYKESSSMPWKNILNTRFEVGYALINKVFASLKIPYWGFSCFAYLVIYIPLFYIFYKRSEIPFVTVFITFCLFLPFLLSGLRQSMSVSISLFAIYLFTKKKISSCILSAILIILSISIHKSAIVVPLLGLFYFIKFKFRYFLVLIPLFLIMFFLSDKLFETIYYALHLNASYLPASYQHGLTFFAYLLMFIFVVALLYASTPNAMISKLFYKCDARNHKILSQLEITPICKIEDTNILIWGSILFLFFMSFMRGNVVFPRFAWFFLPYLTIGVGNACGKIESKVGKFTISILIAFVFIIYFIVFSLIPNSLDILPYKLLFR